MADYISREDALKGQKTGTFANGICLVAEPCVTVKYIESLEPADVVQVVRCRDCKYNANPPEVGNADCDLFYGMTEQYGFCHRAERRTDG